jgi:ectoine hydroxylase-related dioxygenase (phytanoyl-CoA dioxygenase family)
MVTAWIPFHDCTAEMGTITMIDGSLHWPDNTEKLNFFSSDLEGLEREFDSGGRSVVKVPVDLEKGQVSFHHCLTIHGSGPNRGTAPRRSIAVHLQDEANRWQESASSRAAWRRTPTTVWCARSTVCPITLTPIFVPFCIVARPVEGRI